PTLGRDGCGARAGCYGMRKHHRLVVAEVAIGVAEHHAISEGIEQTSVAGLGNAGTAATAAQHGVGRHCKSIWASEGRIAGVVEVYVEVIFLERGIRISQLDVMVGSAARGRCAAVNVGGEKAHI